jgi:ligand-binding sensor domain-containing protein
MNRCERLLHLLALVLMPMLCVAQREELRFEKTGIGQGISNETVISILQDSKGYMWFGTLDGLNKYDGYTFTKYHFDPNDTNTVSQNFIYTIFEDRKGTIWLSTFEGLCKFDRHTEKFTRYKPRKSAQFSDPNITVINEDTEGMLWLGTASGGLCRFDTQKGEFMPEFYRLDHQQPTDGKVQYLDHISCLYKDRSGTLWVGNNTGVHKIVLTKRPHQLSQVSFHSYRSNTDDTNSLSSNIVRCVFEDRSGIMWIATSNGLNSVDRKTGIFKRYLHDPEDPRSISGNNFTFWIGNCIKEDKEGNLWLPTDKGLNKLNRDRTAFTSYLHDPDDANSISHDMVFSLEIDRANVLWAGTWNAKLNKADLNRKEFNVVRHANDNENSLSNNLVTSLLEDETGVIWIGTFQGGLNRWDRKANKFTHFRHAGDPEGLTSDTVNAVLQDRHQCLWVCNGDVLSKLDRKTGKFKHYRSTTGMDSLRDLRLIYDITEDREGLLWLASENSLQSFDEETGQFTTYYCDPHDTTGISDYTSIAVFADSRGNIWIGHGSIATDRFNKKTGRFTHYKYDPRITAGISSNIVNSFYEDGRGNLWLGTAAGGLCHYDYRTEKFITFTTQHGLANNTVYSILEDNNRQLWLGTRMGISKFDPISKAFTNYDYKDGLEGNVFAAGDRDRPARLKGRDGTLYLGSTEGFVYFDPAKLTAKNHVSPIVITQFKLFDKLVKGANELKEIILDHDQNYFSFEFASLDFYNPAKNQYAYKLEGFDKDWVHSGARHYVGYTNIDPGKYTFRVKGTNNDGAWNEQGASVTLIVRPPWWRTWPAYMLLALLIAVGIYAVIQYRITKIRMHHEIAMQKHKAIELEMQALRAQMNPHFIFNSLNSINMFILENDKLQASAYLSKFSRLIRLILQNSREAVIPLQSELEALRLYLELESLRFENKFVYLITVDETIDPTLLKVPPLLIQPYAENAIWHGLMQKKEKGHLQIELRQENGALFCKITDDGIGRKKGEEYKSKSASTYKSFGMSITQSRLAMMGKTNLNNGVVEIKDLTYPDGSAAGTEVVIKIPAHYD